MLLKEWIDTWLYYQEIQTLCCLVNKQDFLDPLSSYPIKFGLRNLLPWIEKDQYPYYIDRYGRYAYVQLPNGSTRAIYDCDYGINRNAVISRVFDDKIQTAQMLGLYSIPTPRSHLIVKSTSPYSSVFNMIESGLHFAQRVWYPVIVKPINGSQGKWVQKIISERSLLYVLQEYEAWPASHHLMIQEFIAWNDYRVIYLDGNVEVAYQRVPAYIVGDWVHTIYHHLLSHPYYADNAHMIDAYLWDHWYTHDRVLPSWESVQIVPTANISTGWHAKIYSHVTDRDRSFIKRIADITGARYFGLDILTQWELADGYVLEINKMPWTEWISKALPWFGKKLWEKIWRIIKADEGIQ